MRLWDPFYEMIQLQDRANRLLAGTGRNSISQASIPAVDVYEESGTIVVEAALPNFDRKDIEANLTDDGLEIKAEQSTDVQDIRRNYLVRETTGLSFYRYINLPAGAQTDQAKASFQHGILRVVIPLEHATEPKRLEIETDHAKLDSGKGDKKHK